VNQIFPDHDPRAVDAGLDAFPRQTEHGHDLVDLQFLDVAKQDHLAIMFGQGLGSDQGAGVLAP
jgi:hypothetical protein